MPKTIIFEPDAWKHSQLSLAARYGGIRINGQEYYVDCPSECLIRKDWEKVIKAVGVEKAKCLIRNGYTTSTSAMAFIRKERAEAKAQREVQDDNQPTLF